MFVQPVSSRLDCLAGTHDLEAVPHSAPHPLPTFVRHFSSGTLARQSYSPFRHYVRPGCSIPSIWSRYIRTPFLPFSLSVFRSLAPILQPLSTTPVSRLSNSFFSARRVKSDWKVCSVENSRERELGTAASLLRSANSRDSTRMWIPVEENLVCLVRHDIR